MTVNYMIPVYPPDGSLVVDWDDNVEASLFLALGLLVLMQLMLLIYIVLEHFQPGTVYRQQFNENCRRRFMNFIFRRLLAQLDGALGQRPKMGQEQYACLRAKSQAVSAIRLFCRDVNRALYPHYELNTLAASDAYFVLDDEQNELNRAGYASVNLDVTDAFLKSLLYPERPKPIGRNKSKL